MPKYFHNNIKLKGELVYCTTNRLKSCVKNKVYRIEDFNPHTNYLKLEGIKTWIICYRFDFLDNNPALLRDFNIGKVLDTEEIMTKVPERKIDITPNKKKVITAFFVKRLGLEVIGNFDDIVLGIIRTNKKVWGFEQKDFDFLRQLSLQDILKILE
jgi:hypothetical protein